MENIIEAPRNRTQPSNEEIREYKLLNGGGSDAAARAALERKSVEDEKRLRSTMPAAFESFSKSQQKIDAAQAKLNVELERVRAEREKAEFALSEVRLLIIRVASTRTEIAKLQTLLLSDETAALLEDKLADSFLTFRQSDTAQTRSQAQADLDELHTRRSLAPGIERRLAKLTAEAQSHIQAAKTTAQESHIDIGALLDNMKIPGVSANDFK